MIQATIPGNTWLFDIFSTSRDTSRVLYTWIYRIACSTDILYHALSKPEQCYSYLISSMQI